MYIESLHIGDFGGTCNRDISFKDRINIIEGNNESGKSTIAAFIGFMLYGFSDKPQRKRYYSWGTKSASGTMTVVAGERRYRIEREHIETTGDKVSIIDLETNLPVFEGKKPEEVFLGVSYEIFSHTAYIGQAAGGYINGSKVSASIENILFSADESIDTNKALKRIDEARVMLQHKRGKGGKIHELSEHRDELIRRFDAAKSANQGIIEKEGTLRETKKSIEANEKRLQEREELLEYYDTAKQYRTYAKYVTLKKKAAELEAVSEALKENYTRNGFFPDDEYIESLRGLLEESERLDQTAAELQRDIDQQRFRNGDLIESSMFVERVNEKGGLESVVSAHKKIRRRKTSFSILAVLSFVFAALTGVFTFLMRSRIESVLVYGGLSALSLVLLGFIFTVCSSRQRINEDEFLAELDVDTVMEFEAGVSHFVTNENRLSLYNSRIKDLVEKYNKIVAAKKEVDDVAQSQALLWGEVSPAEAVKKALEAIKLITDNKNEADKYRMASQAFGEEAESIDINKVAEKLGSRPYTEDAFNMDEVNEALREREFYTKATACLRDKAAELEKELAVLYATVENPTVLGDKVNELTNTISSLTKKLNAYVLAYDKLSEASETLRLGVSPRLAQSAAQMLSEMTEGRYDTVGIDKNLEMKYEAEGKSRDIDYMSAGTRDLAYYSLRLALIDLLYKKQIPPVIFDESFARLDDRRMDSFFSVIGKKELQTLIFTSQRRDAERMKDKNISFNHIRL